MKVPCCACDDRHTGCHAECERYLTWASDRLEAKQRDYDSRIAERYALERDKKIKGARLKSRARGRKQ